MSGISTEKQHDFGLDQGDDFGDFGLDESDSEDEEEFDGLAAYRGDPIVSEFAYCDNSDSDDEQLDPESSCDSSEGADSSCDELDDEGSGIPVERKRRAVWSTAMKKKQKQSRKSLMEPVTGEWVKAES